MSEIAAAILALLMLAAVGEIIQAASGRAGVIAIADICLEVLLLGGAALVAVVCLAQAVISR